MLTKSKIKYIQTLGQKKFRQQEGLFIAEGPKVVKELLTVKSAFIVGVFALPGWMEENSSWLKGIECTPVSETDLERITQLTTPNQVLAVVKQFNAPELPAASGQVILALDGIQDPGNLGTIIRIADWFGISQVVCNEDTAEVYNPKVVQATMGSIARVHLHYTNLEEWIRSQKEVPILATALDGADIRQYGKLHNGIIIIGNEGKGVSSEIMKLANDKITIPGKGNAESLNAAVATGIILSHLT